MAKTFTVSVEGADLKPEDLLHFVETDEFRDDWENLGMDVETDLYALQVAIMSDPKGPVVIKGTGGLRKVRFARKDAGKSGGVRVCYVYFEDHWTVLLVIAYGKNERDDLTAKEKQGIKAYIGRIEKYLAQRNY